MVLLAGTAVLEPPMNQSWPGAFGGAWATLNHEKGRDQRDTEAVVVKRVDPRTGENIPDDEPDSAKRWSHTELSFGSRSNMTT